MVFPNSFSVICNCFTCLILSFIFLFIFSSISCWVFHSHFPICLPRISRICPLLVLVLRILISHLLPSKVSLTFLEDAVVFHSSHTLSLCLSNFTIFSLNLSNDIYFTIIKSSTLLRLVFVFLLSSSIIRFSLCVAFLQCFLLYISIPALDISCLSSFICLFISLTFLCCFVLFSFLSDLLISNLISTALTFSHTVHQLFLVSSSYLIGGLP